MTNVQPFIDAMLRRDHAAVAAVLAEDVVLRSPILADPVVGREATMALFDLILSSVDSIEYGSVLEGGGQTALTLSARVGEHHLEGVELFETDDAGVISSLTIVLRPLPGLVALQNVVAPALGAPALRLTPA